MLKKSAENLEIPTHRYSLAQKGRYAGESVRQRLGPSTDLVAGPFAGEFGWELMQWQGYVRARRPHYRQVHVITYPGRDYLYEGCQMHCHDVALPKAGYGYGLMSPDVATGLAKETAERAGLDDYDIFLPAHLCTQYHKRLFWRQDFRLLREDPPWRPMRDVAFHFRAVDKAGPDTAKNYRPKLADEAAGLCLEAGLQVVCVGHPAYSLCPPGCSDQRSVDLRQTVAAINGVRLVVGENSGPMHLANLCGQPTLIWASDQWRIDFSLRWNPFRVPIYVAANDTHQPAAQRIATAILDSLRDLRERTREFSLPSYQLPAQPIVPY